MLPIASDAATVRSLIVSQSFRLVLAVIGVLLLSPPALSQSDPATPLSRVRGEVVMLTSELVVVKSTDGTNILIPLEKRRPWTHRSRSASESKSSPHRTTM